MRRYFKLWLSFFKMSWMADIEYRTNIVMRVIAEFFWYAMQLSLFEVLYTHTNSIAGWSVSDMRVFMGTLFTADVIYMILFHENMDQLSSLVRKGELDLYLVKPINSQFMVSCRKISVAYFVNLVMCLAYLVWAIANLGRPVGPMQLVALSLLIFCGVALHYAIRFMFCSLSVVLQEAGNIQFVWHQLYRLCTRPDPIYPNALRYIVLTIFPVAFFASVPARAVVEGPDIKFLVIAPLLSLALIYLSNRWWEMALRRYSSASS